MIAAVGQVIYRDRPSGKTTARFNFRAIPRDKFEKVIALLQDC